MAGNIISNTLLNIPYTYDIKDHRSGTFTSLGVPSHVEFANPIDEYHRYALRLKHPNYLAVNEVHLDGNDDAPKRDILIHEKPECTFRAHMDRLSRSIPQVLPVMTYTFGNDRASYDAVTEEFRYFLRGVVKLISKIHEDGHALRSRALTFDNLWYGRGELIICDVEFEDVGANHTRFGDDWVQVVRLIRDYLFANYRISDLADLDSLIHAMRSYNGDLDDIIIVNHLALMSSRDRVAFIRMFLEKEESLFSMGHATKYDQAIIQMGNCQGWKNRYILMSRRRRVFKSVKSCYQGGLTHLYQDGSNCQTTNKHLLRCCRNIATHLKDILSRKGRSFGDTDIDNMVMSTFDKPLLRFHRRLGQTDVLKHML